MLNSIANRKRFVAAAIMMIFLLVSIMAGTESASAASKLKVKPGKKTIYVGSSVTLKANKKVKWSIIKGKKVVKLTSKKKKSVKVKGLKAGSAVIKVKAGKATKKIKITVKKKKTKPVNPPVVIPAKKGVVSINVDLTDAEKYPAGKVAKLWLPVPPSDDNQTITNVDLNAPAATTSIKPDSCGDQVAYIEWGTDVAPEDRKATLSFHVDRKAVIRPDNLASLEKGPVDEVEMAEYLKETAMSGSKTEGIVKETADKIVSDAGATTVYDKAHAIYNWVCDNMTRNGQSQYRLRGDVVGMLTDGLTGGTCVDINATFVAMCRAEGVPAREIIGMWFDKKSPKCRAQFFLPGYGWVEADPSQPLKVIMEDDIRGNADYADFWERTKDEYWGQANEMWMMFTFGRDITLDPPQSAEPGTDGILTDDGKLNVFMFPYGEFDGQYLPSEDKANYKYQYDFVEDAK